MNVVVYILFKEDWNKTDLEEDKTRNFNARLEAIEQKFGIWFFKSEDSNVKPITRAKTGSSNWEKSSKVWGIRMTMPGMKKMYCIGEEVLSLFQQKKI